MASFMNRKYGSSQGGNNSETFYSCRVCNQVFKGADALMVHFDLAHMRKDGREPIKVSPCTPPPLPSFSSQTSSWKIQENAVKINHLLGQLVASDRNPSFGFSSRGKVPTLHHFNKNHYTAWPYPSPTSHTKELQTPKPNIGTFSGALTPKQLPPIPMKGHAPQPRMQVLSPYQEANLVFEARSVEDDYLCTKCKLAKQLHQQGIQVQKSDKEDGSEKLDLSLKL